MRSKVINEYLFTQLKRTTYQAALNGAVVATEHSLLREVDGNLLSDGHVSEQHELYVEGQSQVC